MAYNPYEAVKMIYNLKNDWDKYNSTGDKANATKTKETANPYYQELINNGYANVANTLSNQNYQQAEETYNQIVSQFSPQNTASAASSTPKLSLNQQQINALLTSQDQSPRDFQAKYNARDDELWNTMNSLYDMGNSPENQAFQSEYNGRNNEIWNLWNNAQNYNSPESDELRSGTNQRNQEIWDLWNNIQNLYSNDNQNISDKNNQLWNTVTSDKEDMGGRYNRLEEYNYSNPFTSEQGKSILERYDLAGLQGRDNEAAVGGAGNSGNIDSYSAANALRQQASLRNLGEQTALAAHSRTVNDGRGILSDRGQYNQGIYNNMQNAINTDISQSEANMSRWMDLLTTGMTQDQRLWENAENRDARLFDQNNTLIKTGMDFNNKTFDNNENKNAREFSQAYNLLKTGMNYNQQLWDNNESAIQSEHDRKWDGYEKQAGLTGEVPLEVRLKDNPYFNADGTALINEDLDYQAIINDIDAQMQNTTDPQKLAALQKQKNDVNDARNYKYKSNPDISKLYGQTQVATYAPTAATIKDNKDRDYDYYKADLDSGDNRYLADTDYNKTIYTTDSGEKVSMATLDNNYKTFMAELTSLEKRASWDNDTKLEAENIKAKVDLDIANIEKAMNSANITSNEKIKLTEIYENNKTLSAQLQETARQFDVTQANTQQTGTSTVGTNSDYQATMSQANVINKVKSGDYSEKVRKDWEYYFNQSWSQQAAEFTSKIPSQDLKKWVGIDFAHLQKTYGGYISFDKLTKLEEKGELIPYSTDDGLIRFVKVK